MLYEQGSRVDFMSKPLCHTNQALLPSLPFPNTLLILQANTLLENLRYFALAQKGSASMPTLVQQTFHQVVLVNPCGLGQTKVKPLTKNQRVTFALSSLW